MYDKWCAGCHGVDGRRATAPAPTLHAAAPARLHAGGIYQIRTTASGELPTDEDSDAHHRSDGMPGTAMPEWKIELTKSERSERRRLPQDASRVLRRYEPAPAGGDVRQASRVGGTGADRLRAGGSSTKLECFKCHGEQGRGDGPSAPTLKDDCGHPIFAPPISRQSWNFNGGPAPSRRSTATAHRARRHADAVVLRSPSTRRS